MTATLKQAPVHHLTTETIQSLQELVRALHDSSHCLSEAANSIDQDSHLAGKLAMISNDRRVICNDLATYISINDFKPASEGTFLGGLRAIWTKFRAGLNSGRPDIVLLEVLRAEEGIVGKFEQMLPDVVDTSIGNRMLALYEAVKRGQKDIQTLYDSLPVS